MGIAYTVPTALLAPIVALTWLGVWLDGRFGWTPAASIGGLILGIVCGTINMVRLFRRLE
jgi:F0F1-type ATP synthase assembly protein I